MMDTTELLNMVYDTLFENKQWPQFPLEDTYGQFINTSNKAAPFVEFTYNEIEYKMQLTRKTK